jgi:hypothetical protein
MPTGPYTLDVALLLIDSSFAVGCTLAGLALVGAGPELLAEARRWWRGRE